MAWRPALSEVESWSAGRVRTVAAAVGLAQTCFVAVLVSTSGYFKDDYPFFALARQGGFGTSGLTRSVFGSLVPGFQLGNSLLASFNPIPRWPAVVLPTLLYAVALLLVFRLGELLLGPRPVLIVLMAMAGLSGVLATSLVWWTAGLNSLPAVVCDLLALDGLLRHAATGRQRHLVVSVIAFAVAVSFYDASSSFLVVLVLCSVLYVHKGQDWRSVAGSFASKWWVWAGYLVPIVLNFVWRQLHPGAYALPPLPGIGAALRFIGAGWAQGFIPSSIGINFSQVQQAGLRALVVVGGQVLFFGLVAFSVYRRRSAVRAWAVFGGGFLAIEIVAAIGRGNTGTEFALNPVYWAVQPFILALAIGLAFFPLRPEFDGPVPPRPEKAPKKASSTPRWRPEVVAVVVGATVVLVGLGASFMWRSSDRSQGAMNRRYLDNVVTSWSAVQAHDPDSFVWNTEVPPYVLTPFFVPYDRVATTVGLFLPLRIDAPRGQGYVVADSGQLVPASVQVAGRASGACVRSRATARTLTLPLRHAVPVGHWFLRMTYSGSSGFSGTIGGELVRFEKGRGAFVIPDSPPFVMTAIRLAIPAGASACISAADLELPVAG